MEPKIGETISSSEASNGKRDAFHVPAVLVTANKNINGGGLVKFISPTEVTDGAPYEYDAVADPFVRNISKGESFWVFLRPGTVSNLTHTWTAPTIVLLSNPVEAAPPLTNEESKILKIVKESNVTEEELDKWVNDSCRGCYN